MATRGGNNVHVKIFRLGSLSENSHLYLYFPYSSCVDHMPSTSPALPALLNILSRAIKGRQEVRRSSDAFVGTLQYAWMHLA